MDLRLIVDNLDGTENTPIGNDPNGINITSPSELDFQNPAVSSVGLNIEEQQKQLLPNKPLQQNISPGTYHPPLIASSQIFRECFDDIKQATTNDYNSVEFDCSSTSHFQDQVYSTSSERFQQQNVSIEEANNSSIHYENGVCPPCSEFTHAISDKPARITTTKKPFVAPESVLNVQKCESECPNCDSATLPSSPPMFIFSGDQLNTFHVYSHTSMGQITNYATYHGVNENSLPQLSTHSPLKRLFRFRHCTPMPKYAPVINDQDTFKRVTLSPAISRKAIKEYIQVLDAETHTPLDPGGNNTKKKLMFGCKACEYVSFRKGDLTRHIQIHLGIKPFVCDVCNKRFVQRSALNVHARTHTGEKPFKCSKCGRAFGDSSSLSRHLKNPPSDCSDIEMNT